MGVNDITQKEFSVRREGQKRNPRVNQHLKKRQRGKKAMTRRRSGEIRREEGGEGKNMNALSQMDNRDQNISLGLPTRSPAAQLGTILKEQ